MIKITRFLTPLLFLTFAATLFGSDSVSVQINLYDKKIYYLNQTDMIQVRVTVRNQGSEAFNFRAADSRVFNLDFDVRSPANIPLDHSREFTIARRSYQYVMFRQMTLQPGEEYGFIVPLDRFVQFSQPGVFTVQALFFPDLLKDDRSIGLSSNSLTVSIRPPMKELKVEELVDESTGRIMKREAIPPDEVISQTINARQKSQWEKFFLYLDIERLLQRDPGWQLRYERLSEEERLSLQSEYKDLLRKESVEEDILVIPSEFTILKTSYTEWEAEVVVRMEFRFRDYTELKRYTYYLERTDDLWLITGFEVLNLGTE